MSKGAFGVRSGIGLSLAMQASLLVSRVFARAAQVRAQTRAVVESLDPNASYKDVQRHRRQRLMRGMVHQPMPPGGRFWTLDGQGYEWQPNGSVRRIDKPAPDGYIARARAAFQQ